MKTRASTSFARRTRGSAFVTVLLFCFILLMLTASIITWSLTERRLNMRNAYWLEARNAAEAIGEYGFSQVMKQFSTYSVPPTFDPAGGSPLALPPTSFFSGGNVDTRTYSSSVPTGMQVVGGIYQTIPTSGGLYYVDPLNPDNARDPLKGQYVYRRDVQVLSRATVVPPSGSPVTAFVTEKVSIRGAPLFANAIFYSNNDLEASPGPNLDVYGPVHVNGNMFPSAQGTVETGAANYIAFHGPVSISGNLYHAWGNQNPLAEGRGYSSLNDNTGEPLGNDPVKFMNTSGTMIDLNAGSNVWKDSTMNADQTLLTSLGRYTSTATTAISQLEGKLSDTTFRQYAAQTFNGNLQTKAMGVQNFNPIAFDKPIDAALNLPDPHSIIDPPASTAYLNPTGADAPYAVNRQQAETQKFSEQAGLYIQVTVAAGAAGANDSISSIKLFGPPNSAPLGTAASLVGPNNGILLGTVGGTAAGNYQPAGLVSLIPYDATASGTITGPGNAVEYSAVGSGSSSKIRTTTTTGGTLSQNGTRHYNGTGGFSDSPGSFTGISGGSPTTSDSTSYATSTLRNTALALLTNSYTYTGATSMSVDSSTATVAKGIYDQRQLTGVDLVQLDMVALRTALQNTNSTTLNGSSITNYLGNSVWGTGTTGWNGGVYVEVNAPNNPDGTKSQTSVSLANGKVASGSSLLPSTNTVDGLMLVTNAPVYIVGNFNSDGANWTATSSATTPDDGKTDAAGTPTSAQMPVAIAADAVTMISPTYFAAETSTGSAVPASNTVGTSAYASYSAPSPRVTTSMEVAAAIITGITPTTDTAFSGGVHNLPRFLESWTTSGGTQQTLAIRGSMVSMYKSNAAIKPWAQRYYGAPKRNWGFDVTFQNGHFPPLTPKVMSFRRVDFQDLAPADYQTSIHTFWPSTY